MQYYPTLNKEFFSINPSLEHRSKVIIRCLKCNSRWETTKNEAKNEHGILQLLNHEYGHRNKQR